MARGQSRPDHIVCNSINYAKLECVYEMVFKVFSKRLVSAHMHVGGVDNDV